MLYYSNLQFTNATQLNDPFDCHPSLIDFSNVPKEACGGWIPEIIEEKSKIIRVARKLNPDIKIFQMEIDANAFKLNTKLIE